MFVKEKDIIIRRANKQDMQAVEQLSRELTAYHNITITTVNVAQTLQSDGFEREAPAFRCIVAEVETDGVVSTVGFALYFPTYSFRRGRGMLLQDLYVKEHVRHRGVGKLLFEAVAKDCWSSGCSVLDFHVAEWNRARSFYERFGAVNLTSTQGNHYWRLKDKALLAAAGQAPDIEHSH
ncbi:unnamed protein product [Danaus chrysippus]|uniref:(African queen) hypothetical protein n=1 Tax=Danaus chrysippus TaxID=151541 RepID=A0A8J2WA05_9NEOP|nr:unnamed protein product [Danaus chrysippus]